MEVLDAIRARRAIREYKPDPIAKDLLRQLIDAATWAPSAMNGQSWRFVVVLDRTLIESISRHAKQWILENEPSLSAHEEIRLNLRDPGYHIFHNAPALIVIATSSPNKWSHEGCVLAAENLMLAATSLGLGTCWIGLAEGWLNTPDGHAAIGLDEQDRVVAPVAVGYPKGLPGPAHRRRPNILWLEPDSRMTEDGGAPALDVKAGFYGTLIHP